MKTNTPLCFQEAVKEDDNKNSSEAQDMEQGLGEPSQSYVIEPETSESEATESVTNSEHQADGNQQVDNPAARSFSKAASFTSVDQDVADLQTGMENVRIEEPAEDTADDAKSNSSHVSAQSHISPSRNEAHTSEHAAAATDVE